MENTRLAFIDTSEAGCDDLNYFIADDPLPENLEKILESIKEKTHSCQHVGSLKSLFLLPTNSRGCFINGRKVSLENHRFTKEDFMTLSSYEFSSRIQYFIEPILDAFIDKNLEKRELEDKILSIISIVTNSKSDLGPSGESAVRHPLTVLKKFEDSKM